MSHSLTPYFQSFTWHTCQLSLRNTYATQAKDHPLAIFDAIFKFAAKSLQHPAPLMLFHPLRSLSPRVHKDQEYTLELVFPHAQKEEITQFLSAVYIWLSDTRRHFVIQSCTNIEQKNVATLLSQFLQKHVNLDLPELCLNFITPVPHLSSDKSRKRYIATEQLVNMCLQRVERLYGSMPQDERAHYMHMAKNCTCLPWVWKYEQFQHKAKSTQGVKYIHGFMGPLWLQGELRGLLPILLLCQDLHMGRRLHSGQGAFQLHRHYPFGDALLHKASLWHEATKKLFPYDVCDAPEDYTGIIIDVQKYAENTIENISSEHMLVLREVLAHILLQPLRQAYPSILERLETALDAKDTLVDERFVNTVLPLSDTTTRALLMKVGSMQENDTLQKIITAWKNIQT